MQVAKKWRVLRLRKKWENLFSCEFEKIIEGRKVVKLNCKTCIKKTE